MRELVTGGAELLMRIFTYPMPVVCACTGHALAMGSLVLLAADVRIGAAGDFKLGLNEVAIGMGLPIFATELARYRLTPVGLQRRAARRGVRPGGCSRGGLSRPGGAGRRRRAGRVADGSPPRRAADRRGDALEAARARARSPPRSSTRSRRTWRRCPVRTLGPESPRTSGGVDQQALTGSDEHTRGVGDLSTRERVLGSPLPSSDRVLEGRADVGRRGGPRRDRAVSSASLPVGAEEPLHLLGLRGLRPSPHPIATR